MTVWNGFPFQTVTKLDLSLASILSRDGLERRHVPNRRCSALESKGCFSDNFEEIPGLMMRLHDEVAAVKENSSSTQESLEESKLTKASWKRA